MITLPGFSSTYVSISTFDNVVEEVEFENETKIGQLILIYLIGGHLKKILLIENICFRYVGLQYDFQFWMHLNNWCT